MRTNHTDITILADRSGSIRSIVSDVIGGFNAFLDEQKKSEGTAAISLYLFDDKFETVCVEKDVQEVPELTPATFVPRGMTALLDAIGKTIVETGERLSKNPAEKVVFVIITDGEENSSVEYTKKRIGEMISEQQDKYSWFFNFMAANQDAIQVANDLEIKTGGSITFAANSVGTQSVFRSTSKKLADFRSDVTLDTYYTKEDYKTQEDAGVIK